LTYALWIVQALLALVFLFSGSVKFMMPAEEMTAGSPLPLWFIYFIGAAEVMGAFGLILPGLLKIKPGLTPLAAVGLTIITLGATVLTALGMGGEGVDPSTAVIPLVVCILSAFVAYGRRRPAPQDKRAHEDVLQPAR
jgi:uncharacterized membrane protein YphA (DoxX/SURF4 family)